MEHLEGKIMELKVGLIGASHGWVQILEQIGVGYEIVRELNSNDLINFPVIILSFGLDNESLNIIRKYLDNGGCLLCSAEIYKKISNVKYKEKFVKYLYPDKLGNFIDSEIIEVNRKIKIPIHAEYMKIDDGGNAVAIKNYGDGVVVILPFDAGYVYQDYSAKHKSFYTAKNRLPHEIVSAVTKAPIRRLIFNSLEYLFHSLNLLFCHKWYFPQNYPSIFMFRIDTDIGTSENIKLLYSLSEELSIPITWFIDVKSQRNNLQYFSEMLNQELGVHCYQHKVYNSAEDISLDIESAISVLNKYGIQPKGYAAVYGKWNETYSEVIKKFKFSYSSEFCYDYDNLPSFDRLGNLQIPVHPICIGNMKRQGYNATDMMDYFAYQIEKKMNLSEPIIFYHHPNDNFIEVVHFIFNRIKNFELPAMNFSTFANWWKARLSFKIKVIQENQNLIISDFGSESQLSLRVTDRSNKSAFINCPGRIVLNELNWLQKTFPIEVPEDFTKVFKFNIWKYINKFEDFIK